MNELQAARLIELLREVSAWLEQIEGHLFELVRRARERDDVQDPD